MSRQDFEVAFRALLIHDPDMNGVLPSSFTGNQFIEDILGLQPTQVKISGKDTHSAGSGGVKGSSNPTGGGILGKETTGGSSETSSDETTSSTRITSASSSLGHKHHQLPSAPVVNSTAF